MRHPILAIISAISLPQHDGIHYKAVTLPLLCREEIILWHSAVLTFRPGHGHALESERVTILLKTSFLTKEFFIGICSYYNVDIIFVVITFFLKNI